MNRAIAIAVLYASFAIFAFGHAYKKIDGGYELRATGAVICAMLWPLYVSVQMQKETP